MPSWTVFSEPVFIPPRLLLHADHIRYSTILAPSPLKPTDISTTAQSLQLIL